MSIAWSKKVIRTSEKTNDTWGIHTSATLYSKCAKFENIMRQSASHGVYYALLDLCGPVVARQLVDNGALKAPASVHTTVTMTLGRRRRSEQHESDDEANAGRQTPMDLIWTSQLWTYLILACFPQTSASTTGRAHNSLP